MTDIELIEKGKKGDNGAIGALYQKYLKAIYKYSFAKIPSCEREDFVQDMFFQVCEGVRTFDLQRVNKTTNPNICFWTVLQYRLLKLKTDYGRKRIRQNSKECYVEDMTIMGDTHSFLTGVEKRLYRQWISSQLSPKSQVIFQRLAAHKTIDEIALEQNVSDKYIYQRVDKLKKELQGVIV